MTYVVGFKTIDSRKHFIDFSNLENALHFVNSIKNKIEVEKYAMLITKNERCKNG